MDAFDNVASRIYILQDVKFSLLIAHCSRLFLVPRAPSPYCFSSNLLVYLYHVTERLPPGVMPAFFYGHNKRGKMAREIRETPILYGEDARRFLARMEERHPEPPEVRAQRLRDYEFMKKAYELGMAEKRAREEANGGIDPWFDNT